MIKLNKRQKLKILAFSPMFSQKRGFLQISFAWLFSIIIGAIILFFAIYASVKLISTEESISTTETGKEIAVLLNPLETGFGEERTTPLSIAIESRINNLCDNFGDFGTQEISISQKISNKWTDSGLSQRFYNKYIFSNSSVQGKNFYLFSKPLDLSFKVADLIFLTSANDFYCFADAPEKIKKELENLNQRNFFTQNCPDNSINICFDEISNCDVIINENQKSVKKNNKIVYYETDALMYAAIFSNSNLYECQVKRLMQRLESLALVYNEKESVLARIGCPAKVSLLSLANSASVLEDSSDLIVVKALATSADNENKKDNYCKLW